MRRSLEARPKCFRRESLVQNLLDIFLSMYYVFLFFSQKGVNGVSALAALKCFDLVRGTPIDMSGLVESQDMSCGCCDNSSLLMISRETS